MVRRDIIANFMGRAWSMLMGVAFVPIYWNQLGAEAYGLIGFYATLQAVLAVGDFGLSWTITRELAQARATGASEGHLRDTVRTLELAYWLFALVTGVFVMLLSDTLAAYWFRSSALPPDIVAGTVRWMGLALVMQLPAIYYQGVLNGMDRQPTTNVLVAVSASLRWAGAASILALLPPSIHSFFAWQVMAAAFGTLLTAVAAWRCVGGHFRGARFNISVLRRVRAYALGVMASALAGAAAMQADKLMISRLASLEQFGYYSLAVLVTSLLMALVIPLHTALYPRFVVLHSRGELPAVRELYNVGTQLLALVVVPAALVLIVFPHAVLRVWTSNDTVTQHAAGLVALLGSGTLLYCLSAVANVLMVAAGRLALPAAALAALAMVSLPALPFVVPRFGLNGAAWVWVAATASYLCVVVPATHRRLLQGELRRWLAWSIGLPIGLASLVFATARWLCPSTAGPWSSLIAAGAAWVISSLALAAALPALRGHLPRMPIRFTSIN